MRCADLRRVGATSVLRLWVRLMLDAIFKQGLRVRRCVSSIPLFLSFLFSFPLLLSPLFSAGAGWSSTRSRVRGLTKLLRFRPVSKRIWDSRVKLPSSRSRSRNAEMGDIQEQERTGNGRSMYFEWCSVTQPKGTQTNEVVEMARYGSYSAPPSMWRQLDCHCIAKQGPERITGN